MRHVIVHHHIFKNAGTSVDAVLGDALGGRWTLFDPVETHGHAVAPAHLLEFLADEPLLRAVSSHVVRPPIISQPGLAIYPIVFLRHPVLRVASVYKFLRRHSYAEHDALVPPFHTFEAFIRSYLTVECEPAIRNFQTTFLSAEHLRHEDQRMAIATGYSLIRALAFIRSLPAFGLVERFDESIAAFQAWLRPAFPDVAWTSRFENVSEPGLGSIAEIEDSLGPALFDRVLGANAFDLCLYQEATRLFEAATARREASERTASSSEAFDAASRVTV